MIGITVAIGFVGMVLAPCAVGLYSKWGEFAEISADTVKPQEVETGGAQPFFPLASDATVSTPRWTGPSPVPSLREVAERAAAEVREAQAAAARARMSALSEASRTAARRADAAARLAEAAELELARARRALALAEAHKGRGKTRESDGAERDYLPHDHPSLDFPRSRVAPHRAA